MVDGIDNILPKNLQVLGGSNNKLISPVQAVVLSLQRKFGSSHNLGKMSTERVLDEETWPLEAEAAINDIRRHVASAQVSSALRSSNRRVYINLTTLENSQYCVEMSRAGFRVVGRRHDDAGLGAAAAAAASGTYETPHALLDSISQKYRESFGGELMNKLTHLANNCAD
ncbi:GSK3-beta interaction protein-like [Maniola hyperantus]|uniref:GSK3-beta interaction protein-like n=1 Tax=Aphantopus hyperantus TaxID=2795564 RepID=UPI00374841A2